MARTKERQKIFHQASTKEILACLASMANWLQLLLQNGSEKDYFPFLQSLLRSEFLQEETIPSIKELSKSIGTDSTKATKYLRQIYDDIIELNNAQPTLFIGNKNPVNFYFQYYDDGAYLQVGLDVIPRQYESIRFYFIKAKLGIDQFWVKRVDHEILNDRIEITVWLEGGFLNRFRELAVDEALFKGWIGLMDEWQMHPFKIDKILKSNLR